MLFECEVFVFVVDVDVVVYVFVLVEFGCLVVDVVIVVEVEEFGGVWIVFVVMEGVELVVDCDVGDCECVVGEIVCFG